MSVNNSISNNTTSIYTADIKNTKKTNEVSAEVENEKQENSEVVIVDTYEKSETVDEKTSSTIKKVNEIESEGRKKLEAFKKMFEKLLNKQGEVYKSATVEIDENNEVFIKVDAETKAQAIKDTEEGGYYSPKETSTRILDFAKSLAGGDSEKLAMLKKAVEKGFENAAKEWGSEMPKITKETYDLVMKGFEELENPKKEDIKQEKVEDIKKAV